ncbi:MAG: hypothetical protein CO189_10045 [candidate division Zixibacteria bacterium CG_4_9_14_3_um_filter_46_8]|nr:MAG: hypothetical protein CO189_10045 [candidate division Zixibacteria bacterium CG_4_9_14_3_um_filter_46_8]
MSCRWTISQYIHNAIHRLVWQFKLLNFQNFQPYVKKKGEPSYRKRNIYKLCPSLNDFLKNAAYYLEIPAKRGYLLLSLSQI